MEEGRIRRHGLLQIRKARADIMLQLSAMTLPHGMVRVLLAEQLYRAYSILNNHPYHRPLRQFAAWFYRVPPSRLLPIPFRLEHPS